jgi:hypothetical protein
MRHVLSTAYLDYLNNYLSVATYAEHNGLTVPQGQAFIALAKSIFESSHPDA